MIYELMNINNTFCIHTGNEKVSYLWITSYYRHNHG